MRERASERVRSVGANICAYNTTAARAECVRRKQHRTGQAGRQRRRHDGDIGGSGGAPSLRAKFAFVN